MSDQPTIDANVPLLEEWEQKWTTSLGAFILGDTVILRGKDIFRELSRERWMANLMFGICGRQFNNKQVQLFEGIWTIAASYPDPRIWNNRMATLTASARSLSSLGVSATIATSEAIVFGNQPMLGIFNVLCFCKAKVEEGQSLATVVQELLQQPVEGRPGSGCNRTIAKIPGFGRPVVNHDERIEPVRKLAKELGLYDGPHVVLAQAIEQILNDLPQPLKMNIITVIAALCLDQGLTAKQLHHYMLLCFVGGAVPCAVDALEKPEGAFFPLRCANIVYQGMPLRKWNSSES